MRTLVPLGFLAFFILACGGSENSPSAPTATRVDSVAVAGPDVVLQGTSLVLWVIATLSTDVKVVDATPVSWSTDNPGVGSIDDRGRLTAHASGTVIVSATYQGVTGKLKVLVPQLTTNGHVVVAVTPDPVRGSSGNCQGGLDRSTPTWTFTLSITETQGIGFRLEAETFNLYNDDGRILPSGTDPADDRFAPYSMFVEEVCTSLFGSPSGSTELIFTGTDDTGSQFTTAKRVRLLPVEGTSAISSRSTQTPMVLGIVARALGNTH